MEKAIVWYKLWLKLYVKKLSAWIFLVMMGVLLWIIAMVNLPHRSNFRVGICYPKGSYGAQLEAELKNGSSIFVFEAYEDKEKLYQDVLGGRLECGFLFDEDFQEKMEKDRIRGSITCISTPLGFKSAVAKETLYAHLLKVYSKDILKAGEEKAFGQEDSSRTKQLLEREQEYRLSQAVFQLEIVEGEKKEEIKQKVNGVTYPLQAAGGLLMFIYLFLAQGRRLHGGAGKVEKAMLPRDSFLLGVTRNLAVGTLPAIVLLVLLELLGGSRGWLKEGGLLLLLLIISSLWSRIVGYHFQKETTFVGVAFGLALLNLFICPVLVDLSSFLPAMKYISLVFPLGVYLWG